MKTEVTAYVDVVVKAENSEEAFKMGENIAFCLNNNTTMPDVKMPVDEDWTISYDENKNWQAQDVDRAE